MKIQTLLEKVLTGKKVKFFSTTVEGGKFNGNKVMCLQDLENKKVYIIQNSLVSYVRFAKWEGKEAIADIQPSSFRDIKTKDFGFIKPIRLSTDVEVERDGSETKQDNNIEDYDL